jgi:hypothetical protein
MPVNRDLSSLPRANDAAGQGWVPDSTPRFGHLLAEAWAAKNSAPKPHAMEGSRFRHSDAGTCSRAVAYASLGVPVSNPMDLAGFFVAEQGTLLHDAMQAVLVNRWGSQAEIEVKVGGEGWHSGHIDAVVRTEQRYMFRDNESTDPYMVSIEIKSVGGFAFKLAVGNRGAAQGPKWQHVLQAALNAAEIDADESVVLYLSREAISIQEAGRKGTPELMRFMAEWTQTRDEYLPLAQRELRRVHGILGLLAEDQLPARKIPEPELAGALIVDPRKGSWITRDADGMVTDAGEAWQCAYCRWQDVCTLTPAERTPLTPQVRATLRLLPEEG